MDDSKNESEDSPRPSDSNGRPSDSNGQKDATAAIRQLLKVGNAKLVKCQASVDGNTEKIGMLRQEYGILKRQQTNVSRLQAGAIAELEKGVEETHWREKGVSS